MVSAEPIVEFIRVLEQVLGRDLLCMLYIPVPNNADGQVVLDRLNYDTTGLSTALFVFLNTDRYHSFVIVSSECYIMAII